MTNQISAHRCRDVKCSIHHTSVQNVHCVCWERHILTVADWGWSGRQMKKKKKPDFWFASRLQRAELHSCLFTCSSKVKSLLKITPRLLLTDFALECTLFAGMVWNTKICHDGVISPLYPLSHLTSRQRCNRQKLHVSSAFLCKVSHGVVVFVLIYFVFFHFCICRLMAVCKH